MPRDPAAQRQLTMLRQRRSQHLRAHETLAEAREYLHIAEHATDSLISLARADNASSFNSFDLPRS